MSLPEKRVFEVPEEYRLIFESSPVGIYFYDSKGVILECNPKFCDIIGAGKEKLIGLNTLSDLTDQDIMMEIRNSLETGFGKVEKIYTSVSANKSTPVIAEFRKFKDSEEGEICGVAFLQDTTPKEEVNRKFRRAEASLKGIINNLPMFGVIISSDGQLLETNKYFNTFTKNNNNKLAGVDFFETFFRELEKELAKRYFFKNELDSTYLSDNIFEFVNEEGLSRIVSWTVLPEYSEEGELLNLACIGEDVTRRVNVTNEKLENERKLKHALSGSGQGVWEVDFIERKLYLDPTFLDLLELPREQQEFGIDEMYKFIHRDDFPELMNLFKSIIAGEKDVFNIEVRILKTREKNYQWSLLTGSVMEVDSSGTASRVIGTQVDIDSKRLERKYLEIERDFALKINRKMELDELLQISMDAMIEISSAFGGGIYLTTGNNDLLLKYHRGLKPEFVENARIYGADSPPAKIVEIGDAVFIDYSEVQKLASNLPEYNEIFGVGIFPLVNEGTAYGNINIVFDNIQAFELVNRKRVTGFAKLIASAISKVIAEELLRKSEAKYSNFIKQTSDAIICLEYDTNLNISLPVNEQMKHLCSGRIIEVNSAFSEFFETKERISLISKEFREIFDPKNKFFCGLFSQFISNNFELVNFEYSFVSETGSTKFAIVNINTLKTNENIHQLWISGKDITRMKQFELALVSSESKYSSVVENASEIILIHTDGVIKYINSAAVRYTGFEIEELVGHNVLEFVHPEEREMVIANISGRFENDADIVPYDVRLRKKDGTWFYGEIHGSIIEYEDNKAFLIFIQDITTRKLNEKKIRESEQQYRSLSETTSDGILMISNEGYIKYANKSSSNITGFTNPELIGMELINLIPLDFREVAFHALDYIFAGKVFEGEGELRLKSGEIIPISISIAPIINDGIVTESVAIFRDITKRKMFENELKESEARLRTIFSQIPAIVWAVDKDGILTSISGSAMKLIGVNPEDYTGVHIEVALGKIFDPDYPVEYLAKLEEGLTFSSERIVNEHTFETLAEPLKDDAGNIIGSIGVALDITEKIKVQEIVSQLTAAVEQSPTSIVITDTEGNITYVNNKFVEATGYTKEEALDQNPRILKSGELSSEQYTAMWNTITAGGEWSGEFHNRRKNGELFWEKALISPVKNSEGKITSFVAVKEDITEYKRVQDELTGYRSHLEELVTERTEKLHVTEERFRQLAEYSKDIIIRFSPDGRVIYYNPAFTKYVPAIDRMNVPSVNEIIFNPEIKRLFLSSLKNVTEENRQITIEINFPANFWFDWTFIPESDSDGEVVNIIVFAHDITEQINVQEKMRTALAKEKELNKLKSNFISMASHEFRTPLTAILASADLLEMFGRKWEDDKYFEHTAKIQRAVEEMTELLDEVLTLSRYESGRTQFNPEPVLLDKYLVDTIANIKNFDLFAHNISYVNNVVEKTCLIDTRLINQILNNLFTNAVKYSEPGSEITFEVKESTAHLIFKIKDSGIGISQEEQRHIFDPFYRGTDVQDIRGTGLGLNIVQESIAIHRGYINVKSEPGKGSTFEVYIPKNYE